MAAENPHTAERAKIAFFDVDETVIRFKSMFRFQEYYHSKTGILPGFLGAYRYRSFLRAMDRYLSDGKPREFINAQYYRGFQGRRRSTVRALARQWFRDMRNGGESIYIPAVVDIIRRHQADGARIVLVSGSFVELLEPIAEELGVSHILATRLETLRDRYTGNILPPQMIGDGKAIAVRALLAAEGVGAAESWAYGDHISDIAMLEEVDHPNIVSRDPHMVALATERHWGLVDPLPDQEEEYHA
ncbi:MAG: HAD-IB family hydrolase [Magnetospirillum sp.]|nr:HAD-IB family hydrolase [Magnetospirillum sp.]